MHLRGLAGLITLLLAVGGVAVSSATADTTGGAAATAPSGDDDTGSKDTAPAPAPVVISPTKTVSLTRSQAKSVQRKVGVKADGVIGAKTRAAISRYQGKKKLTRTGKPNLQTLRAMKLSFADAIEQQLGAATQKSAAAPPSGSDSAPVTSSGGGTPSGVAQAAVAAAQSQIGTPYKSAGTKPGGFDCSGLTLWAFDQAGVDLPRTSFDQFEVGTSVQRADIQAGDLVFFATDGAGASHVGIATSATTAISSTSHGVREHDIFDDYWGAAYVGARRVA